MKILITGTGRSGTGYMAKVMQAAGYDVQHERYGEDGTSDWHAIGWKWTKLAPFDTIIHVLRNPIHVLRSFQAIRPDSWGYMANALYDECPPMHPACGALWYWLQWNRAASSLTYERVYLEGRIDPRQLPMRLTDEQVQAIKQVDPKTNTREGKQGYDTDINWKQLSRHEPDLVYEVIEYLYDMSAPTEWIEPFRSQEGKA